MRFPQLIVSYLHFVVPKIREKLCINGVIGSFKYKTGVYVSWPHSSAEEKTLIQENELGSRQQ